LFSHGKVQLIPALEFITNMPLHLNASLQINLLKQPIYVIIKGQNSSFNCLKSMDQEALLKKEEEITSKYQAFLDTVREAFNKHCDEIKDATQKKIDALPEDDEESRERILEEEKAQLDQTLSELRQILARKEAEIRAELEEIARQQEEEEFVFEEELADVEDSRSSGF
jgi:hypothetical protein